MTSSATRRATSGAPTGPGTGGVVRAVLIGYVLYLVYGCLLPFDWFSGWREDGSYTLFSVATNDFTLADIISNIFLYVPAGFLLFTVVRRPLCSGVFAALLAVGVAGLLSVVIEAVQAYSPSRVSSTIDVVSNVVGATLGAGVAWVFGYIVPRFVGAVLFELRFEPQLATLKAFCAVLVVAAAVPFSFSFDVGHIQQSIRRATVVPFTESFAASDDILGAGAPAPSDALGRRALAGYNRMNAWSRWAAEWASFVVLGWLAFDVFRRSYGFTRGASAALVVWVGVMGAVGLSVMQLFVVTRGFHGTDIVMRLGGLGVGLGVRWHYACRAAPLDAASQWARWRTVAVVGCVATGLYIVVTGLMPFIQDPYGDPIRAVQSPGFLPFHAYFEARFDRMMRNLLGKVGMYMLLAGLFFTGCRRMQRWTMPKRVFVAVGLGLVLSVPIEIAQVYLRIRVTSLTDPMLACGACALGAAAQAGVARLVRFARSRRFDALVGPAPHTLRGRPGAPLTA